MKRNIPSYSKFPPRYTALVPVQHVIFFKYILDNNQSQSWTVFFLRLIITLMFDFLDMRAYGIHISQAAF